MQDRKIIVIYDGDILAFRASAVAEERSVLATHIPTGKEKVFKNKTELKDSLKSKGKEYKPEDFDFKDIQEPLPESVAFKIMKNKILQTNSDLFADEYVITLSGKSNFRDLLPLPTKYKDNRTGIRPLHLKACKEHLWKKFNSRVAMHEEADDVQIYTAYEYYKQGYTPIVATIDKDANAYSGISLYDFTTEGSEVRLIPDGPGYLEVIQKDKTKKVKGLGLAWYCFQSLVGDKTDTIYPYELANVKGFGEISAYNILKDCKTEQDLLLAVLNTYKEWYPDKFLYKDWQGNEHEADYLSVMQMYHKCIRMKETKDDTLNLQEFYSRWRIDL